MAKVTRARAWCNNEVAYLAWETDGKIPDCLGFMITRIHLDDDGRETERRILPAWAAFTSQSNPHWHTLDTSVWPIQKFTWRDLTLRRLRDKPEVREPGFKAKYEIAPVGKAGPGRRPVPNSGVADPSNFKDGPAFTGEAIPLFFCGDAGITNVISIDTDVITANGKSVVSAGFTNGILSTQNLRQQLKTPQGRAPTKSDLEKHIQDPKDEIRRFLTADALPLMAGFMARAKAENCDLYMALYELNDPSLLAHIKENADRVHLILSTAGASKPKKGSGEKPKWDTTNTQSRADLRNKVAEFHDRMFNNAAHIGHNKFAVLVDRNSKKAKAVLSGSTNWTFTGLCTQSNNVVIVDDPGVADAYFEYWQRLRDDKLPVPKPISAPNNTKQGPALRKADQKPNEVKLVADGKTGVTLWYSPNTDAVTKPKDPAAPPDLANAFELMKGANKAIFFLTFMPSVAGDKSIIAQSIDVATAKPDLLVLGAISDGRALPDEPGTSAAKSPTGSGKTGKSAKTKKGTTATKKKAKKAKKAKSKKKSGRRARNVAAAARADVVRSARRPGATKKSKSPKSTTGRGKSGADKSGKAKGPPQAKRAIYVNPKAPKVLMVRAAAIGAFDLIGDWEQEMLKYGQAIIHDKIVVVDPLSDDCVVITGSHNLGYKASYANDENMLIVRGNKALAIAYTVHILDVYDHYKFRAILEQQAFERASGKGGTPPPRGQGILNVDDSWQDKFFGAKRDLEQDYFMSMPMP